MGVKKSVGVSAFNYFDYTSRSVMAGLCGSSVFNFLRNRQNGYILHPHQQCTEVPILSLHHQHC
jgi:hypothetical protein